MKHFTPPAPKITDAARLYRGDVMHQRMRPVGHRFSYEVFSLLIDIDRLDEADGQSRIFSVNRANLASFFETDHIRGSSAANLRGHVDKLMADAGLVLPAHKVLLACYPRVFGQVFNPLSVFYAFDAAERAIAMIYQVRNTFGEDHTYVCPVGEGEATPAGIRQSRTKLFHVSPFLELGLTYHFRMNIPGDTLKWRILETDADGPLLAATYSATAEKLTTGSISRNLLRIPLLTWKIVAGIHFEALRLWLKGVAYVPHSAAPERVSHGDASFAAKAMQAHQEEERS